LNGTPWNPAERTKSRLPYSPFSGSSGIGLPPVTLKAAPSRIGRQLTVRPCLAAIASIFCEAK